MRVAAAILCLLAGLQAFSQELRVQDPLSDYLGGALSRNGYIGEFRADDKLFSFAIDLNGDGQPEQLVSLSRDSQGRAGNVWAVYKRSGDMFERVGEMVFNSNRFYLGRIDELGGFGLLNFRPSGAGEGHLIAYVYDGDRITSKEVGEVKRDDATNELQGSALVEKYFDSRSVSMLDAMDELTAEEFSSKYHVEITPNNTSESTPASDTNRVSSRQMGVSQKKHVDKSPAIGTSGRPETPFPWLVVVLLSVAASLFILFRGRRK